jgi:hypothetical protein
LSHLSQQFYAPRPAPAADGLPAGYTFFAQFLTHDLSFDNRPLPLPADGRDINHRTPALDLDSVYGLGPDLQPYLYEVSMRRHRYLLVDRTEMGELDLPRVIDRRVPRREPDSRYRERRAVVADPRNDENLIVSQLHLAVMRFHNACVKNGASFEEGRRLTRWHYQWLVVNDLLERLCGATVVRDALGSGGTPNLSLFPAGQPGFMPLEFAVGAFRAGHALVGPNYVLNDSFEATFGAQGYPIFWPLAPERSLIGSRELPHEWSIQWDRFFDVPDAGPCQRAQRLGPYLDPMLRKLPIAGDDLHRSLSFRTLLRAWQLGAPSGQAVAEAVTGTRPAGSDPLWLYVLKEADEDCAGARLGRVGASIVAETVIALLAADPDSYYATDPTWEPAAAAGRYTMVDFLRAAGMPITAADWAARGR